ncbi:ABC transporter ATP-binding protein [Clostridium botulinum C]|uniref:ABC transporter ATP-binding protein n=2 Tax=Clostridium botulinum TaxID=1491 RepID=A0A9Q4TM96_CLOBO|nr:ABC transporter ATP-binding protein [Clostridium botulinum]EGO88329.1 hypothetical protein CBCST_06203 [Clostridium botulinum C str. Stockholm]MCD3196149.1 ABC transporter ATP-binding protein [Clostridium botulinum C]MCD3201502.1 ABC transporter ATP-binding protein [Clostridium botulinum C]MCD3207065.1 ABC transporter ATP-binding protein [Clostridium botulinum C]MCD3209639.1 ABC transporter ATP-binding protein [Clostridium botulinum C]
MDKALIKLCNISKKYNNEEVLKDINMKIEKGKIYIIMGPSGAGKSTLLNIISLIEPHTSGEYLWNDENINNFYKNKKVLIRRNSIGIIFQDFNLFEELTVFENLDIYLKLTSNLSASERENKIIKEITNLDIKNVISKKVKFLSGGERQRTAIARCYLTDKEILLADEPSANVDSKNKKVIISSFLQLKQKGKTIIIVTHDPIYKDIGDVIYKIENGQVANASINS